MEIHPTMRASGGLQGGEKLYRNSLVYLVLLGPYLGSAIGFLLGGGDADLTDASGSNVTQLLSVFILLNSIVIAIIFRVPFGKVAIVVLPAAIMLGWTLLSVAWSEFPDLTVRRAAREIIEVLSLTLLALSFREEQSLARIIYWTFLIVTMLDLASIALPSHSMSAGGFQGIHGNKNTLGATLYYALPILLIGAQDRTVSIFRFPALFAFVAGLAMLSISSSKSAIGLFALASMLVMLVRLSLVRGVYSRIIVPAVALMSAVAIVVIVWAVGIDEILTRLFGDATLTGRDQIWRYALSKYDTSPQIGVGYGALWQVGAQFGDVLQHAQVHWLANQAHNGYIDILAQLGHVGLICLIVYWGATLIRIIRSSLLPTSRFFGLSSYALYLLIGALMYNMTESSFFRAGHPTWMLLVLVSAYASSTGLRRQASHTFKVGFVPRRGIA
jgi:O-antigen ligase